MAININELVDSLVGKEEDDTSPEETPGNPFKKENYELNLPNEKIASRLEALAAYISSVPPEHLEDTVETPEGAEDIARRKQASEP